MYSIFYSTSDLTPPLATIAFQGFAISTHSPRKTCKTDYSFYYFHQNAVLNVNNLLKLMVETPGCRLLGTAKM